jgi:hypothetical protein
MSRKSWVISGILVVAASFAVAADSPQAAAKLTAAEIADKNVAARGGLEAWRAVKTLSMSGKMGAGGNQRATLNTPMPARGSKLGGRGPGNNSVPSVSSVVQKTRPAEEAQLPFLMELARPRKSRLEIQFNGQTAIQVYDGVNGWKVRPFLNRHEVESYTPDEMKSSSMQTDLDGPLVDYAAKGTKLELVGTEKVEDRDNYKLKMTMKSGQALHVWIDAQTFLETKIEGQPRRLDGSDHPVEVWFRDYRTVSGLQVPFLLETKVLPVTKTAAGFRDPPVPVEKTLIEKVVVNPKLDDSLFTKPDLGAAPAAPPAK